MDVIVEDFGIEWTRKDGIVHKADFDDLIYSYEKHMPIKPKKTKEGNLACKCGLVVQVNNKRNCLYYCHNCGQKLDW